MPFKKRSRNGAQNPLQNNGLDFINKNCEFPCFIRLICVTFCVLVIVASFYEQLLINQRKNENELATQPIHSVQTISEKSNTNGNATNPNHIYTYENGSSDIETSEQQGKVDKIHTTNIINGCTLELLPISAENNNGNLGNNNRNIYRLNNNNKANNNHNGNNCTALRPPSTDGTMAADNKPMPLATNRNGSTAFEAKAIDLRITDGLSKWQLHLLNNLFCYHFSLQPFFVVVGSPFDFLLLSSSSRFLEIICTIFVFVSGS